MSETKIEWADCVINPLPGCSKVSPACHHCYAERMAARLATMPHTADRYAGLTRDGRWTGETRWVPSELEKVFRWRKPRAIFVGSMGDVPGFASLGQLTQLAQTFERAPQHAFLVLTKRPERMAEWAMMAEHPLPNVWLGCTVEDQQRADERMPGLWVLATMGWKTWVSYEPALSAVDWDMLFRHPYTGSDRPKAIIAGGESGPGARPSHPDWFRAARDACAAAGVDFHFKQWGEWAPWEQLTDAARLEVVADAWEGPRGIAAGEFPDGTKIAKYGKHNAGRTLDGREHNDLPWRRWLAEKEATHASR